MAVTVPTTALWFLSLLMAVNVALAIVIIFKASLSFPLSIVILVLSSIALLWILQWSRTSTRNDI